MQRRETIIAISVVAIVVGLLFIGYVLVPYIIANGGPAGGLDIPAYSVLALGMSKGNGNTCYLTIVILNNGNVNIRSLSVKFNGSDVWSYNESINTGQLYSTTYDDSYITLPNHTNFFGCPNSISVGQSYPFFMEGVFADGLTENLSTTMYITPYLSVNYTGP